VKSIEFGAKEIHGVVSNEGVPWNVEGEKSKNEAQRCIVSCALMLNGAKVHKLKSIFLKLYTISHVEVHDCVVHQFQTYSETHTFWHDDACSCFHDIQVDC